MANIFLQLSQFQFKRESLQAISGANSNQKASKAIDDFFKSNKTSLEDYGNILIDLLAISSNKQSKQKLLIALVYFIVKVDENQSLKMLQKVLVSNESVLLKVKFFSFVFKSTSNQNLKKWLLKKTIVTIQNEQKVSSYAGIIEHLDQVMESLSLEKDQVFQIYVHLISYLEKHPVYKKLSSNYVIKSLQNVTDKTATSQQTYNLIVKVIKSGVISDRALNLLNHAVLKKNELYPILQVLLTGDFEKLNLANLKNLEKDGLVGQNVLRKMKIQAIPRLLSNVKVASYNQIAQILSIKKQEVQSYLIDAIQQGVIKAKLDQYQETVIINRINFRALRQDQRAKLQKDITNLIQKLNSNLKSQ